MMLKFIVLMVAVSGLLISRKFNERNEMAYYKSLNNNVYANESGNQWNSIEIAEKVIEEKQLHDVRVKVGIFDNYFRPSDNAVQLTMQVAVSKSNSALLITLHELMHAFQYNKEKVLFDILLKTRIAIKKVQRFSLYLIGISFIATFFLENNHLYIFSILLPLLLKFLEEAVTLYVEYDAWKKVKKLKITQEIIKTKEDIEEAKEVVSISLNSYILSFVRSIFVFISVAAFFYIINTLAM